MSSKDVGELRAALIQTRSLSTSLRAESTKLQRRPRQQMEEWADQALSVAYIIEHQLERLEGKSQKR